MDRWSLLLIHLNYRHGRFFAIAGKTMYMITGDGPGDATALQGGINGIERDALENAALVDTGETEHVALLFSPDYGQQRLRLYIGKKGYTVDGTSCGDCSGDEQLLSCNGLSFGSWFMCKVHCPEVVVVAAPSGQVVQKECTVSSSKISAPIRVVRPKVRIVYHVSSTEVFNSQ